MGAFPSCTRDQESRYDTQYGSAESKTSYTHRSIPRATCQPLQRPPLAFLPRSLPMGRHRDGYQDNESGTTTLCSTESHFGGCSTSYSEKGLGCGAAQRPPQARPSHPQGCDVAYRRFLADNPEYCATFAIDELRRTDYRRLTASGETYVDWMGGALYPERLVHAHADFLCSRVLANTHSHSNPSALSHECASSARAAVLQFFDASPEEYTVIFTPNASGALKLVGEAYPFTDDSAFVLGADSHNSVNGIRRFAEAKGASVAYIAATPQGGFELQEAEAVLNRHRPSPSRSALFALTAQSNISNSKAPLALADIACTLGYDVLLDAAALAPTSPLSLTAQPAIGALAISFYKMFGYPTGVGALVIRRDLLQRLRRPWFAGGTVDLVQVPGNNVTPARELHEQFEDGTINYTSLAAVPAGLRLLAAYQPLLPLRLTCLLRYMISELQQLRYKDTDSPFVRVLSRIPMAAGEAGATASIEFLGENGIPISPLLIEQSAARAGIALRTGCACNPGGAAALLGITADMAALSPGATHATFEDAVGRALGVVRISLGLVSNFEDVWRVVQWASNVAQNGIDQ
ncbi:pyridoxal phosphate-dependent transferase [Schizophyllum commune]